MSYPDVTVWGVILALGLGTWGLRFSFLGLVGARAMPRVRPGLVAPRVVGPAATGGSPDPARIAAALATVAIGLWSRNLIASVAGGMAVLYAVQALTG